MTSKRQNYQTASADRDRAELRVRARVARLHRLSAHLALQSAGGLGLEVIRPPPRGLAPLLDAAGFKNGAAAKVAKG